jgi:hypothetical protein
MRFFELWAFDYCFDPAVTLAVNSSCQLPSCCQWSDGTIQILQALDSHCNALQGTWACMQTRPLPCVVAEFTWYPSQPALECRLSHYIDQIKGTRCLVISMSLRIAAFIGNPASPMHIPRTTWWTQKQGVNGECLFAFQNNYGETITY